MNKKNITLAYFIGLMFVSSAIGCLTKVEIGCLVFGSGTIAASALAYLNHG